MKIVILTGIYPPAIGGPATYSKNLAKELSQAGHEVTVITYGNAQPHPSLPCRQAGAGADCPKGAEVITVSLGFPIVRWFRYATQIRKIAAYADVVYALSLVSCGVPLWLSGIKTPKRVLRLGGDFLWERYTDNGGTMTLREWYAGKARGTGLMRGILRRFHHIVFSTAFQEELYEEHYNDLPAHSVIENALEQPYARPSIRPSDRPHTPFRLLFMGRFVGFKNLFSLLDAFARMQDCVLTLVGDGPLDDELRRHAEHLNLHGRVQFVAPVAGTEKQEIFDTHDLLILPSFTEISPNTALEAAAAGLPVLLTEEHGLSERLLAAIDVATLRTPEQIVIGIRDMRESYLVAVGTHEHRERAWKTVAQEHVSLFEDLLELS